MKISVRQICFIMCCYTVVGKLLLYPTTLCSVSGRGLLFSSLIDFAVQTAVVWAVAYLCSKTDKTFFGLLENTFGKVVARIIFGLFALFFLGCALLPMIEQMLYVDNVFYDNIPTLSVFLPFFVFSLYAGGKRYTNVGRCADICMPIFAVTLALIFVASVGEADFSNLLPLNAEPFSKVLKGAIATLFRFTEPAYLLFFMGRFEYKKGDAAKITLSYALGGLIVLAFLAVFYGIYGDIAVSRQFAVSKISLYFPAIETIGRVDLIALYILEIVMLFALVLNIQLSVYCLAECTGYNNTRILSLPVNAVLLILLIVFKNSFHGVHLVYSRWLWIAAAVFAAVIPVLCWTLRRKKREN